MLPSVWMSLTSRVLRVGMKPVSDLNTTLEAALCAGESTGKQAFRDFVRALKAAVDAGEWIDAAQALKRAVGPDLDYSSVRSLARVRDQLLDHIDPPSRSVRLAVLGSFTTTQLVEVLELQLFAAGIGCEIYESEFGVVRQEILDPTSQLYEFDPGTVYLATDWRDLAHAPPLEQGLADVKQRVTREIEEWSSLWEKLHRGSGAR